MHNWIPSNRLRACPCVFAFAQKAAQESADTIREALKGSDMVFVTVRGCLGIVLHRMRIGTSPGCMLTSTPREEAIKGSGIVFVTVRGRLKCICRG